MDEYLLGINITLNEIYYTIKEMESDNNKIKSNNNLISELNLKSTSLEKLFKKVVLNVKDTLD
jgi:hypothetical protein